MSSLNANVDAHALHNLQTVRKPSHLDRSTKNLEFTSGTPDTQPDTPDFKSDRRSYNEHTLPMNIETCDDRHVFSPIGHSSINLRMDYEAETDVEETIDMEEKAEFASASTSGTTHNLAPVAEKSSKRRMFEALRAIARTPEKEDKEQNYTTKKDFMSALRGFAATPVKKVKLSVASGAGLDFDVGTDCPKNEIVKGDDAIVIESSLDSTSINTPIKNDDSFSSTRTPEKNSTKDEPMTGIEDICIDVIAKASKSSDDLGRKQGEINTFERSESFSPDTKEIMRLNSALEDIKSKLYDGFDESDTAITSKALDDYRAAVEDYRAAIQEFESEMSQTTTKPSIPTEAICEEHPSSDVSSPVVKSVKSDNSLSYSDDSQTLPVADQNATDVQMPLVSSPGGDPLCTSEEPSVDQSLIDSRRVIPSPEMKRAAIPKINLIETDDTKTPRDSSFDFHESDASSSAKNFSLEDSLVPLDRAHSSNSELPESPPVKAMEAARSPETQGYLLGSTNVSTGSISLTLQEKFAMFHSILPDISPAKSEFTSVYGGASVASTVVTQKMSAFASSNSLLGAKSTSEYADRELSSQRSKFSSSNVMGVPNTETTNANETSSGLANANTGSKSLTLQEKFAIYQSNLPDVSPAKSEFTSVHGGASVAPNVVTQQMGAITASYLVSPEPIKETIERPMDSDEECESNAMSPNLLDKATCNSAPERNDPNAPGTDNTSTLSDEKQKILDFGAQESVPSPNLLDKASGFASKQKIGDRFKNGSYSNLRDNEARNLHTTPTKGNTSKREVARKSMHERNTAATSSYLPSKYESQRHSTSSKEMEYSPARGNQDLQAIGGETHVLDNVMKLNLGPALTKEIMQSILSGANQNRGGLGINHINIDVDYDDHSEVSSLGTSASIVSHAALSTLSALARSNPNESIENLIRGFNRIQRLQLSETSTDSDTSPLPSSSQDNSLLPTTNKAAAFGRPFYQTGIQGRAVKLQPSRADMKRGRRRWDVQDKKMNQEVPAVAPDVLNAFERLQEQIEKVKRESRVMEIANKKVERACDEQQNEKLMNQFERIEKLECQRRWDAVKTAGSSDSNHVPILVAKGTPPKISIGSINDWFVEFDTSTNTPDSNEPFSSLLRSDKTPADDILIETKKKIYAANEEYSKVIDDACNGSEDTSKLKKKKKKKKKVLKKMANIMRRKKLTRDDEGSIGIASVTSLNTADDAAKKKNKLKFLSTLRRKKKKTNIKDEGGKCDSSQLFEEEDGHVSESIIIDAMDMMDSLDVDDSDDLDESFDSDASSHISKSSCAYATLS